MDASPGVSSLLLLLLLASQLGSGEAAPTPQKFRISGRGRADPDETVTLSCHFLWRYSASPSSYVWIKNGEVIPGETRGTLTFSPVTTQDTGIYQCGDPNSNLERLEHDLYVVGARLPQPEVHVLGVEVLGRSFPMECIIMKGYIPNSRTVYTWYKDGAQIQGQSGQVLRFPRVREADAGMYTCTMREGPVETTSPPTSPPYHLLPLVSPELRIKTASPDDVIKGILGENLTLTCEVTRAFPEVPADGYSWSYVPSPQGPRRPLVGKASTLTLGPLTREDGGQYFCQARNDQIFPQHKDLNLTGHASVTVHIVYLDNMTLTSDLEVKEGDPVTLTCSVDSLPAASLAWTVNGQEVRHVTDNRDHYFIPRAGCSDSTSYTCRASNTDLPGREMSNSTRLHVLPCNTAPATSDNSAAEVSATFDFRLPDTTSLVVVHPGGQDMVTVQQDCSSNFSSAFLPRLLHPRCDPAQRVLSFTLAKVTEEDVGNYTCREDRPSGKLIPSCRRTLSLKGVDSSQGDSSTGNTDLIAALGTLIPIVVVSVVIWRRGGLLHCLCCARRRLVSRAACEEGGQERTPLLESYERQTQSTDVTGQLLLQGRRQDFQALYQRGKVYVIPPLPAQQPPLEGGQADLGRLGQEEAKVCVLRLLCDLLEEDARFHDSPVFVFTQALPPHMHAVIYHSEYGVIIVKTEVVSKPGSSLTLTRAEKELRKAARQLGEAGEKVEEELRGLLEPGAVTLLLALPNLENRADLGDSVREQLNDQDIHLLRGRKANLDTWSQLPFTWERRPACWNQPECYQAFVTAVSRHLCMEGYSHSQTEGRHSRLLATPEQAAVLRCTDKRLHIWGPPNSGKTLLVLDRTRRWLRNGKTVVMAVCSPDCQLLLHRLGRESLLRLTRDTASRLTLCCDPGELKKTLQELGQQRPPSSICIIIDHIDSRIYSVLLEASRSAAVECVWTTGQRDLPAEDSDQLKSLGGRSVLLPHPLRCHPKLLPLARELLPPGPLTPVLTDPPCLPARLPPASVKVTLHPFHPDYRGQDSRLRQWGHLVRNLLRLDHSAFDCKACSEWLRSSLSPLVERLPLEDERWRHWVILLTGDWGSGSRVTRRLVTWLNQQEVPAVREWKPEHRVSRLPASSLMDPSRDQGSEVSEGGAAPRARVLSGEDREGRPAVHVIPVSHFTGLEKARVLAVHYDWRDDHPDHQSQKKKDARLSQHRDQLFQAVTRCQTELAVWLLSPSPAASLLQGHEVETTAAAEQTASQADQAPSPAAPPASPPTVPAPATVAAPAAPAAPAATASTATAPAPEVGPAVAAPSPVAVARSNVQQQQQQ